MTTTEFMCVSAVLLACGAALAPASMWLADKIAVWIERNMPDIWKDM